MGRPKTKAKTYRIKNINYEVKGFTLVEVLVSAAILGFLIAGVYGVLNIANITYNIDMVFLDLQQNARLAIGWMVRELRESSSGDITIDVGNDKITFDTLNESNIRYYLDASENQIVREYPAGTTRILANNIESLNFYLNGSILVIQVTAKKAQRVFFLKEQVRLRNE